MEAEWERKGEKKGVQGNEFVHRPMGRGWLRVLPVSSGIFPGCLPEPIPTRRLNAFGVCVRYCFVIIWGLFFFLIWCLQLVRIAAICFQTRRQGGSKIETTVWTFRFSSWAVQSSVVVNGTWGAICSANVSLSLLQVELSCENEKNQQKNPKRNVTAHDTVLRQL